MSQVDWLSHLLQIITVTGQLEDRCAYGAPWRVNGAGAWERGYRAAPSRFGACAARRQRQNANQHARKQGLRRMDVEREQRTG